MVMYNYTIKVRYTYNIFDHFDKYVEIKLKSERQLSQSDIEVKVLEKLYGAQCIKEISYEIEP
jgi:hypothetical protein